MLFMKITRVASICVAVILSAAVSSPVAAQSGSGTPAQKGGVVRLEAITIKAGDKIITADLVDNPTSRDFLKLLPLTLPMTRWGDREYYGKPAATLSSEGERHGRFQNGDVAYWVPGGSFAIFFDDSRTPELADLIVMGKITSDLSVFSDLGRSVQMTIERASADRGPP